MARRFIVSPRKIQELRASNWSKHYQRRMISKVMNLSPSLSAALATLPAPALAVDAAQVEHPRETRLLLAEWSVTYGVNKDLLCSWYWTDRDWMSFVRAFQELPEPQGDYYYKYIAKGDYSLLLPVDNVWISGGKVRSKKYKSPASAMLSVRV